MPRGPMGAAHGSDENVEQLVKDLVGHVLAKNNVIVEGFAPTSQPTSLQMHVRHTVDALVADSPELFTNIGEQLHMSQTNIQTIFYGISDEIFLTGINWGRIVAFLAFGGSVATYCATKHELTSQVPQVAHWMSNYIDGSLKQWIQLNGGWNGFIDYFRLPGEQNGLQDLDLKRWGVYALAGFSLGALLVLATTN